MPLSCSIMEVGEILSATTPFLSGNTENSQLPAREGWLQPIFNLTIFCRLQLQHLPNAPPAPNPPLVFLPLVQADFVLPQAPCAAASSAADVAAPKGEGVGAQR